MSRFDVADDSFAKNLQITAMSLPFPIDPHALYREHWEMMRSHGGRKFNWTVWHRGVPSRRNIDIFMRRYPAFEILEHPAFSLDGEGGIRRVMTWCHHENHRGRFTDQFAICDGCEARLRASSRKYGVAKRD